MLHIINPYTYVFPELFSAELFDVGHAHFCSLQLSISKLANNEKTTFSNSS